MATQTPGVTNTCPSHCRLKSICPRSSPPTLVAICPPLSKMINSAQSTTVPSRPWSQSMRVEGVIITSLSLIDQASGSGNRHDHHTQGDDQRAEPATYADGFFQDQFAGQYNADVTQGGRREQQA